MMNGTKTNGTASMMKQNGSSTTTTASTASKNTTSTDWSQGIGLLPGRDTIGPLLLMMITPIFSIVYFHVCSVYHGNFITFLRTVQASSKPLYLQLYELWPTPFDSDTLLLIGSFVLFQCILIKVVPGPVFIATMTPNGHRPQYTANGISCYIITIVTLIALDLFHPTFHASIIYDKFGTILSSMNCIAFLFCIGLVIKGYTIPSSQYDSGTNGSIIQDFYWGTELYPRIFTFDVKQMTNCRLGMMFWAIAILGFGYKNMELHSNQLQCGIGVSILLQLIYITKFFHWEMGYMCR
jgi:7-dehydrocholesterol reductase